MVKDGEDWHGLQTTKLKSLPKLFKPFNRDWAPLITQNFVVLMLWLVYLENMTKLCICFCKSLAIVLVLLYWKQQQYAQNACAD